MNEFVEKAKEHKFLIIGGALSILFLVTIFLLIYSKNKALERQPLSLVQSHIIPSSSPLSPQAVAVPKKTVIPAPLVQFASYTNQVSLPTIPQTVPIYNFKTTFTDLDAEHIARQVGFISLHTTTQKNQVLVSESQTNTGTRSFFFDKKTGAWSFVGEGLQITHSDEIRTGVTQFLKDRQLVDDVVTCPYTYRRKSVPGVIYIECHRDWGKLGLPLLQSFSVLNLGIKEKIMDAPPGQTTSSSTLNPDIYDASDGGNGFKRAGEFNTITVGVRESTQSIAVIASNIRPIQNTAVLSTSDFLQPYQVENELTKGSSSIFSMIVPLGSGSVDIRKLVPQSVVSGRDAKITDMVLAYPEAPLESTQSCMSPHYFVRGTAVVSGYEVGFVQIIPATQKYLCEDGLPKTERSVLGAHIDSGSTIQYGTFPIGDKVTIPTPVPTLSATPLLTPSSSITVEPTIHITEKITTVPPTPTTSVPQTGECIVAHNCYGFNDGSKVCWWPETFAQSNSGRQFYYFPAPSEVFDPNSFDSLLSADNKINYAQFTVCPAEAKECPSSRVGNPYDNAQTACYPMGARSPRIYLNSDKNRSVDVKINPSTQISYVYPQLYESNSNVSGQWKVQVKENIEQNVYYEYLYNPQLVQSHRESLSSRRGFISKKSEVPTLIISTIASQFGLTETEARELSDETTRELKSINSEYVKISFINSTLLDTYLPMFINPSPDRIYRIHLFISKISGPAHIEPPVISKIQRDGFTIIETGVIASD